MKRLLLCSILLFGLFVIPTLAQHQGNGDGAIFYDNQLIGFGFWDTDHVTSCGVSFDLALDPNDFIRVNPDDTAFYHVVEKDVWIQIYSTSSDSSLIGTGDASYIGASIYYPVHIMIAGEVVDDSGNAFRVRCKYVVDEYGNEEVRTIILKER